MGYMDTYKLDGLGKILLPKVFRERYGWKAGDTVTLWDKGGVVLIKPHQKKRNPECIFCGTSEQKMILDFAVICGYCAREIG